MMTAFDYDAAMRVLAIRFRSGAVVTYQGVPPDVAQGLDTADSAGRYFHASIKDRFTAK